MSTGSTTDTENFPPVWTEEELGSFLIVLQTIFEVMIFSNGSQRVRTITEVPAPLDDEGHMYKAYIWEVDRESEHSAEDPLPAEYHHLYKQFMMTNRCDFFAGLMKGVVQQWARVRFGTDTEVYWLHHVPKPESVFFTTEDFGDLASHSVLGIKLPNGAAYIYNGTEAQYGRSSWLVPLQEYTNKYVRWIDNEEFYCMADEGDLGVQGEEDIRHREKILDTIEKILHDLDWAEYRFAYEGVVRQEITALATPAFTWMQGSS